MHVIKECMVQLDMVMVFFKNLIAKASKNGITIEILSEDTDWMEISYE
jgi:hypothetical protein